VSAHDISDGGAAVAAAEMAFAGRRGITLSLARDHGPAELFGEGPGRYLVEVKPDDAERFGELLEDAERVGWVAEDDRVRVGPEIDVSLAQIEAAFRGHVPGYQDPGDQFRRPDPDGSDQPQENPAS